MPFSILALLDGLGGSELLVIGLIALLLFGSKRMPELGRGLGRAIREFKRATSGVEENIREVLYAEPPRPKLRPPAQRRPYRDPSTHAEPSPASNPPPAATAPRVETDLNEPAPLEMPDFAADPENSGEVKRHEDDDTPSRS